MNTKEMRTTAADLRERAKEIREERDAFAYGEGQSHYPSAGVDAELLERAAALLERAADELDSRT